jgi:hypothetical protein
MADARFLLRSPYLVGNSGDFYIYEQMVATIQADRSHLSLGISDLASGKKLWEYELKKADDTIRFFSSPLPWSEMVTFEGANQSPKVFLRWLSKGVPSIQMRKEGDDYLLCIGRYYLPRNSYSAAPGGLGGSMTIKEDPQIMYIALRRTKTGEFEKSPVTYSSSIQTAVNVKKGNIDGGLFPHITAEGTFYLFGEPYYGWYDRKKHAFFLERISIK